MNKRKLSWLLLGLVLALAALSATAAAASAEPRLKVGTVAPDYVASGDLFRAFLNIQNVGDKPLEGQITVTGDFPVGTQPVPFETFNNAGPGYPDPSCEISGQQVTCQIEVTGVKPGKQIRYRIDSSVEPGASGPLPGGHIEVSGGGAPDVFSEPFGIIAGNAPDAFSLSSFDVGIDPLGPGLSAQAGSDPSEISTRFSSLSQAKATFGVPNHEVLVIAPTENFRDVVVHVPLGLVGDPTATPVRCSQAQLTTEAEVNTLKIGVPACPPESQVGLAQLNTGDIVGVFNVEPPAGSPAAFGFFYNSIVVTLLAKVRPGDNGIDIVAAKSDSSVPLPKIEVTLWGDPTNASHDPLRGICIHGGAGSGGICPLNIRSDVPFLRTPTSCPGTDLPWSIEMDTYQHPGTFVSRATSSPKTEGCEKLPFDPGISLTPSERAAGSPSGLDVNLAMPQEQSVSGLAEADVRSASLELPTGVAINAASADGLAACTDAQLRLGLEGPSECPDAAKVGSLELKSPLLEDPLSGSVYLRSQASNDPESGDLFRLALEIRSDERGVDIKLPGSLKVNPDTGQLTTTFGNLPQLPFESMQLHLKTGPRAPLTTPPTCGTYAAQAEFEGWNGKVVAFDPKFNVDQGCTPPPFDPGFEAGVSNPVAGGFSPFSLRVTRGSGQPNVSRIDATLPEGELAKLAGVTVCGQAQAASGECPAGSRIGSVVAGIGEGAAPLYLPQPGKAPTDVYFAGPYKGAPYSIVARVPAQAGPFDLGQVLVRSAVRIDPATAQVTVASDPLPQIFAGVPVSYRDVRVNIDRPEYTLNPTDCEPTAVTGAIASIAGQTAQVSDRFQVGDCASLGFKPKLAISLKGRTRRSGNPALTAVLQMPKGGANIARTSVALPHSEFLAQGHIDTSCTRVQYNAGAGGGAGCPKGSVYGRARAFSPLLDSPLEGPVYLRSNGGERELPDLVASLGGQIHVDLVGYIDTDRKTGGLRTTFAKVPDAPVSKFVLKMPGGRKSLLENSTNICRGKHHAVVKMDGQNGRAHDFRPLVRANCGKGARSS